MSVLPREFYQRDPKIVAQELLGKLLVRELDDKRISGIIVETEAYLADNDEAAHAFKGKTNRNKSLFLDGGHAYVYRIHAQHCLDAVCQTEGVGGSVLIRAVEPVAGIEIMQRLRGVDELLKLTTGPGKLCKALAIDMSFDGADLTLPNSALKICTPDTNITHEIISSSRIGISKAKEHQLRFYIKHNKFISR
jgi:DNA-3-methyladenine glycosylase